MRSLPLLLGVAACATLLPVQAAVYSCVNAQGERTISDKPCPPTQATQKIYQPPRVSAPPAQASEDELSSEDLDPNPLMPQTPEELRAMLRARERAAAGLPPEDSAEERAWLETQKREQQERQRREPQRQMESYLRQKEHQRQEWRSEREDGALPEDYEEAARDRSRQSDCSLLQRQKNAHTAIAREAFISGNAAVRASHIAAEREVSQRMHAAGCN